ncbi:MAG: Response regulator receiver protein [Nitrospira sp.]|jgi:PAS domain S-box-containing protein|nr:MAG: Response regulator receiver protein [Nitrospira sp.]
MKPIKILLVEDNAGDARLLRELLAEAGADRFILTHVDRLAKGISSIQAGGIEIVLLDLSLPDSQGFDTLLHMHKVAGGIPIVVMTGIEDETLGLQLVQAGAQDYLIKGQVTGPLLTRSLRYAIERKHAEKNLSLYREIIAKSNDAIAIIDPEGRYLEQNAAHRKLLGFSDGDLRGKTPAIHLGDDIFQVIAQNLAAQGTYVGEVSSRTATGTSLDIHLSAFAVRNEAGDPICYVGIKRDITEREQVQTVLATSEERFRSLVSNLPGAVYRSACDPAWTMEFLSDPIKHLCGYPASDFIANRVRSYASVIHPDDRKMVEHVVLDAVAQHQPFAVEYRLLHKGGGIRWVYEKGQGAFAADGRVLWLDGAIFDITDRKRAEEALLESEERSRSIVQSTDDAIILMDTQGRVAFWNNGAERTFGYTAKEMVGQPVTRIIPERFREAHQRGVQRVATTGRLAVQASMFKLVGLRKDGSEFPLEFSLAAWTAKSKLFITCIIRDISERAQAESALRESEERFRAIMDHSPALIFIKDVAGRYLQANRQFETIFHLPHGDLIGKTDEEVFPPEQAAAFRANDHKVLEAGAPMEFEETALHDDGPHTSLVVKFPLLDAQGRCYALCGIATDITDRKRVEEERQQLSRARLLLLESTGEGIYGVDRQGRCTFVNTAAARMLGYRLDEMLGKDMHELIHHSFQDGVAYPRERCHIYGIFANRTGCQVDDEVFWRKDGTAFPVEYSCFPVLEQERMTGAVVIFLDITQRKRAEQQLTSSHDQLRNLTARLESVREEERILIAREIHDELGQALTGVKLELSLLRDQLSEARPALLNRLESISTLVDSTSQSVRRIATELRPVVLDQLGLIPAIEWQAHEFRSRTGIQCTLDIYLRSVTLSQSGSTAMFRIFQEILTNVTRHAQASAVNITLREQAGGLILEVRDNGRGVTEAELSDPKSLGLVGMRERALLLGGETTFTGSPGTGTTVKVRIPLDTSQSV